jgi:hypothetical protein
MSATLVWLVWWIVLTSGLLAASMCWACHPTVAAGLALAPGIAGCLPIEQAPSTARRRRRAPPPRTSCPPGRAERPSG